MNISPFLSTNCPCDEALPKVNQQLKDAGLRTVQTFDLHSAMSGTHGCSCVNHGTEECDCQMVVLLVYGGGIESCTGTAKEPGFLLQIQLIKIETFNYKLQFKKRWDGKKRKSDCDMSLSTNVSLPRQSFFQWISNHGFETFLIVYGLWVFIPFLAPVFMDIGWTGAGKTIYFIYSFFCHQLPERSFFFFGEKSMYALTEIQAEWQNTADPMVLRQFIGNVAMGWKVAWSDRMISFYSSIWFFAVLWYSFRRRTRSLPWWGLLLLLVPITLDGITHAISDLSGIGLGFRDTNSWLATLTDYRFLSSFYAGDAIGSFNSLARLITGLLAGFGIVWFAFPYVYRETS